MRKLFKYCALLFSLAIFSQEKDGTLQKGNGASSDKKYAEAEADYRISESKFPKKAIASYNLGNTIYKINQPSEAGFAYRRAIESAETRGEKHEIMHNLGNVFMKEKDYSKAVQAYKAALRNDPSDGQTRYNFALAKKLLKENPPKQSDEKGKNKDSDKKNKDKDKKEKNDKQQKEEKQEKPGENKDQQNKQPENGQPKPQEGGISKQRLDNLLEAVDNEEKKVQDKVNKNKVKGKPVQTDKDW